MKETKDLIFSSMREASEYFGFPYDGKTNKKNDKYLSCYCDWERIKGYKIKINEVYATPKEFEMERSKSYKYDVGDIIATDNWAIKVLSQIRIKRERMSKGIKRTSYERGYSVECTKDGYIFEVLETSIPKNCGCPVCSNHKVIKGLNDIATTHPEVAKYFENIEETYSTTYSSGKKKRMKCPRCGHVKIATPNYISRYGFSCPCCSDGITYPNKFMSKLLQEIGIEFDREVTFDWCKFPCYVDNSVLDHGIYDFVIPEKSLVIEMDGSLGHGKRVMNTVSRKKRKVSIEETVYRDKMKDILAKENGYNLIRIDCEYDADIESRFRIVKTNVIESELSKIFDFSNINFERIDNYCLTNSYVEDVSELWNKGYSSFQIVKETKLSDITVCKYLNIGSKLGLCDYQKDESKRRGVDKSSLRVPYLAVYNNKTQVFSSFSQLEKFYKENYGIKLYRESVVKCINKNRPLYNIKFSLLTHEQFNNYYNNRSLVDLVVGEAF